MYKKLKNFSGRFYCYVKVVISGRLQDQKFTVCDVSVDFKMLYGNMHLDVLSICMDRTNHVICHLISCHVFPATISVSFSSKENQQDTTHEWLKSWNQYLVLLRWYCEHHAALVPDLAHMLEN
jgi:hypothetical protein